MNIKQWDIITFAEEFWRTNKHFPSQLEIVKEVNISQSEVNRWLAEPLTRKHLAARGIDWTRIKPTIREKRGKPVGRHRLTDKQIAAVATVLNQVDTRSVDEKLRSLGVNSQTWNGWKKNTQFLAYLEKQSKELLGESMPEVRAALATNATNGHLGSIKFLMEVTGEYRPGDLANEQVANYQQLIGKLIEVIQRHVTDPGILAAIATDIKLLTAAAQVGQANQANQVGQGESQLVKLAAGQYQVSEVNELEWS